MSEIIIGKVGGEDWVGTNDGGVGRLLFKLKESESIFDDCERLREENQRLTDDIEAAVSLMNPSWQHAATKEPDIMTRYVKMSENQFNKKNEEIERLNAIATKHAMRANELYVALGSLLDASTRDIAEDELYLACEAAREVYDKSRIEAEQDNG